MVELTEALSLTLGEAEDLLRRHSFDDVANRLRDLQARLTSGDRSAIGTALSESTGSMGSLRDVFIYTGDTQSELATNEQLGQLVERIRRLSEAALST